MISIKINDINNFLQNLLVKDTFDSFLICSGEIITGSSFSFDGHINKAFFDKDEIENLTEDFATWKNLRNICFEIIKGKKVPTRLKLVMAFPKVNYSKIVRELGSSIAEENISGLYFHIIYESNQIHIITSSSLNLFTMDKSLDNYWDKLISKFLESHFDTEIL